MIRWFTRKVVKFVLEALLESDDFDILLGRLAKKMPKSISNIGSVPKPDENKTSLSDDIDSTQALADAMVVGGNRIEMSEMSGDETVNEGGEDRKDVMSMLNNIGD